MTIQSISQLDPITTIANEDLFNVSRREETGYSSKSIKFGNIISGINEEVCEYIAKKYDIPDWDACFECDFSMVKTIERIKTISAENMTFYGVKTFVDPPIVDKDLPINLDESLEKKVPNAGTVKKMIQAYSNTIAPSSIVDFDPENNSGHTAYYPSKELIWHFDDNTNDSSLFIVDETTPTPQRAGYISCNQSGWLNIYGWITDGGNVLPQEAWVGLFAKLKVINQTDPATEADAAEERVIMVQCHPWVVGSKSSTMQYVSFGLPVKKGLQLKIKTGFKVSGNATGLQHSNSLLFNDAGMMPNTFVGYIIYNQ